MKTYFKALGAQNSSQFLQTNEKFSFFILKEIFDCHRKWLCHGECDGKFESVMPSDTGEDEDDKNLSIVSNDILLIPMHVTGLTLHILRIGALATLNLCPHLKECSRTASPNFINQNAFHRECNRIKLFNGKEGIGKDYNN